LRITGKNLKCFSLGLLGAGAVLLALFLVFSFLISNSPAQNQSQNPAQNQAQSQAQNPAQDQAQPIAQQISDRLLTVRLQGVFSSKISLIRFEGIKALYADPVAEALDVKQGETVVFKIPAKYLPAEFLLRLDYRAKETDHPYPTERNIFINNQDIELSADPLRINNCEFNKGETENTAYAEFLQKNYEKRAPIETLKQFLLSYDRQESGLFAQAVKEFDERRREYNAWLDNQAQSRKGLFISNLFQFQHMPKIDWQGLPEELPNRMLENFFEGIDFSNPLIIRSREMSMMMSNYMGLYGMQATTEELRDKLFIEAGRIACEKASKGHPEVYGWMVDYFYNGYETYNIKGAMALLKEHIDNPNCLSTKKEQITRRLEGSIKLVPGALSPDFSIIDINGNEFNFHEWKGKAPYKLLVFSLTGCSPCKKLKKELAQWYSEAGNKDKVDIVVIGLNDADRGAEQDQEKQNTDATLPAEWRYISTTGSIKNPIAKDYAVLSAPAMFLIDSENNTIVSIPDSLSHAVTLIESA
jgi:thioredoxin-related protein